MANTAWCSEIGSLTSLMHVIQVHPVTAENQFHCTRLYIFSKFSRAVLILANFCLVFNPTSHGSATASTAFCLSEPRLFFVKSNSFPFFPTTMSTDSCCSLLFCSGRSVSSSAMDYRLSASYPHTAHQWSFSFLCVFCFNQRDFDRFTTFKAGPPLEAILVIFGRRALIFFLFESSWKKMKNDTLFVRMRSGDHLGDAKMSKKGTSVRRI